ncbi:hypothetical protein J7643_15525 [bacterium]|nr:hypothetical protein [bacterium]
MTRVTRLAVLAGLALSASLSGCGTASRPVPVPSRSPSLEVAAATPLDELKAYKQEAYRQMGIDQAQQAKLKALVRQEFKGLDLSALKADYQKFATLMEAPTVDVQASNALLGTIEGRYRDLAAKMADVEAKVHGMLSDEQRKKALGVLADAPSRLDPLVQKWRAEAYAAMLEGVTLTPQQQAGLQQLQQQDQAKGTARLNAVIQADSRYYRDMDKLALTAAFQDAVGVNAGREAIAWATTLDQAQRKKMVANAKRYTERILAQFKAMLQAD